MASLRVSTPVALLSEMQPMAADILSVLISLSNCLTSSFASHFFCVGCITYRAFAAVKNSSSRPWFQKIMRLFRVSDLTLLSSRCGKIIAAFLAAKEIVFSSINDSSCLFINYMNWKPGIFSLRTMKCGFQLRFFLIYVVYFKFKFLVDKFPGVRGDCSDCWGRWIRLSCLGQYVCFGCSQ